MKLNEFRERITLYEITYKLDDALNRTEYLVPLKTVWAAVTAKSSKYTNTDIGERPEIIFDATIRKNDLHFGYIGWKGELYALLNPVYNKEYKYTCFQMVKNHGKKNILTEFPQGRRYPSERSGCQSIE